MCWTLLSTRVDMSKSCILLCILFRLTYHIITSCLVVNMSYISQTFFNAARAIYTSSSALTARLPWPGRTLTNLSKSSPVFSPSIPMLFNRSSLLAAFSSPPSPPITTSIRRNLGAPLRLPRSSAGNASAGVAPCGDIPTQRS